MSKFEINRSGGFFIINVNVILTLQLSPHVGHFDISTGFRYKKWKRVLRPCLSVLSKALIISEVHVV